jgi:hypothetical protein
VRVNVSDQALTGDLKAYLEAAECSVRLVSLTELEVSVPRAPSPAQASREVALYLGAWQVMNPGARANIVDDD